MSVDRCTRLACDMARLACDHTAVKTCTLQASLQYEKRHDGIAQLGPTVDALYNMFAINSHRAVGKLPVANRRALVDHLNTLSTVMHDGKRQAADSCIEMLAKVMVCPVLQGSSTRQIDSGSSFVCKHTEG